MEYLKQAEKEIREDWFGKHKVKQIHGQEGFQRIVWGQEGSNTHQVEYVLSGNNVFVSGNLGAAVYSLTCPATIKNVSGFHLSYFTGKLAACQRPKYDFDDVLAKEQIEDYFLDWCGVEKVENLNEKERELLRELSGETLEWSSCEHFSTGVYAIYRDTDVDWFDSETASLIADCGSRLSYSVISYWVGLKMIGEELNHLIDLTQRFNDLNTVIEEKYTGDVNKAWEVEHELFQKFGELVSLALEKEWFDVKTRDELAAISSQVKKEYESDGFDYGLFGSDAVDYFISHQILKGR